jgi:bacterioferritin
MAVSREDLIEALNDDLASEYKAIVQYIQYSSLVKGLDRPQLAAFLRGEIVEEQRHAQFLADKIVALGGVPTAEPKSVPLATDNRQILHYVLQAEEAAVRGYKERVRQADDFGDVGLRVQLENMVQDETSHLEEVQKLLSGVG